MGILCRLAEFDALYKFTEHDAIIVQWSSWTREDRWLDQWRCYGNVFNNPFYDADFKKKYWSWENDIIKNSTAILTANKAYPIAYQFNMLNYLDIETDNSADEIKMKNPVANYWLPQLPLLDLWPIESNSHFFDKCADGHPDIANHLHFFDNHIDTKFDLDLGSSRAMLHRLQLEISNNVNKNMEYFAMQSSIINTVRSYMPHWNFEHAGM